ncbi:MAG TPA: TMEM175 family protein, partial [Acidimicrobiales bacterium]|nr:TMEM175 family protein [Acidimicrobiales bacterium]
SPNGTSLSALRHEVGPLLVYLLSFANIAIYWNNHHHLLRRTERISTGVMWANMALLFALSLVPVATDWLGRSYTHTLPAAAYGVVAIMAAIAYYALTRTIIRANPDSPMAESIGSDVKGLLSLVMYGGGVALSFVTPYLAIGMYVLVALTWFVPDRRLAR